MNKPSLSILGVHRKSEGYPNTLFRLEFLEKSGAFDYQEIRHEFALNGFIGKKNPLLKLFLLARFLWAHLCIFSRYIRNHVSHGQVDIAYLPYPAIFVALFLAFIPRPLRPRRIFLDAFISLYDTIVFDRGLVRQYGLIARILWRLERRAYLSTEAVIVDTAENARYITEIFQLPTGKAISMPLATDELHFAPQKPHPENESHPEGLCTVLFVGTMIPLHGVASIIEAAQRIEHRPDIRFRLIGDGQDAQFIERIKPLPKSLEWVRNWLSSEELAEEISKADICLGIFGAGDKAQRVCPYKIYAYAGMGKCIVTADTKWSRAASRDLTYVPFLFVPPDRAEELSARLIELADKPHLRQTFARSSRRFYDEHLCNRISEKMLLELLLSNSSQVKPEPSIRANPSCH